MPFLPSLRQSARTAGPTTIGLVALSVAISFFFLRAYGLHPSHPHVDGALGWWEWFDQKYYYASALAFAHGDLSADQHLYMPGYSLLAAPFIPFFTVHAFAIVNLTCLLVSLWLFAMIAGRLFPNVCLPRLWGGLIFTTVTCLSPLVLDSWVVPWTTSASTPLTFACLLAAICFIEQPRRAIYAFWCGLAAGCILAFRPTDVLPVLGAVAFGMLGATISQKAGIVPILRALAFGAIGAALPMAAIAAMYGAIYGAHPSHYILVSGQIGFEWRNLPLRWVILMLDPRPFFTDGQGMFEVFPWMIAGFAGIFAMLSSADRTRNRLALATISLAIALHTALYLSFRDLHSGGLFTFRNYHYFKWIMPMLALYGAMALVAVVAGYGRRLRMLFAACLCLAVLLPWRAEFSIVDSDISRRIEPDGYTVTFERGLPSLFDAILVPASGEHDDFYYGPQLLTIGKASFGYFGDVRTFSRPGGFMMMSLRTLPEGPARLVNRTQITLDRDLPSQLARQVVVFGLPCLLPARYFTCPSIEPLPPKLWPTDGMVVFSGAETDYLGRGWSSSEPNGRWTDGYDARVRVRPARMDRDLAIAIVASPYTPLGSAPLNLTIRVNGAVLAERLVLQGSATTVNIKVPARLLAGSAYLDLALDIDNPRAPKSYDRTSLDGRMLGLHVNAIRLTEPVGP